MTIPSVEVREVQDYVVEILTTTDLVVHMSYAKSDYPQTKTPHGHFVQIYKGEKTCEGAFKEGQKDGTWSYFVNNSYHPLVREFYHQGRKVKQEVLQNDGQHLRMVFTFDDKERPLKQIVYADDGQTIVKLDVFQNGLLKEENKITPQGQEQTVLIYNEKFQLIKKQFYLNDDLVKIENYEVV